MFPAFGFGAQIPPSFQVTEYVNTTKDTYFRRRLYIQSWLCLLCIDRCHMSSH